MAFLFSPSLVRCMHIHARGLNVTHMFEVEAVRVDGLAKGLPRRVAYSDLCGFDFGWVVREAVC